MSDERDEFDRQFDGFVASWRGALKDPELTYVLGNLRGFVSYMRAAGFQLRKKPEPLEDCP